jgi:hypothetical protein
MNPFVNPNKRDVALPKGCKDLADMLNAKKCQYCDDLAVPTFGWPEDYRWCEACQRYLMEFAKIEVPIGVQTDTSNKTALAKYHAEMQQRQDNFMRQKVKERRSQ